MADMGSDHELDRVLARGFGPPDSFDAHAESIEPSFGFTASVMERVREEAANATALAPIRFPWLRAVPGICMVLLAVGVCATVSVYAVMGAMRLLSQSLLSAATADAHAASPAWVETVMRLHLGWLAVGMVLAFVPFLLLRSLNRGGHGI
jgi:hypothetical protein